MLALVSLARRRSSSDTKPKYSRWAVLLSIAALSLAVAALVFVSPYATDWPNGNATLYYFEEGCRKAEFFCVVYGSIISLASLPSSFSRRVPRRA
jgi:hypothetical protein